MDSKEVLETFGISKKFGIVLFIQSIFVIISVIFAINTLQYNFFNGEANIEYLSAILVFLNCIFLLIYSFYEYNKNTQYFFIASIVFYIINGIINIGSVLFIYMSSSIGILAIIIMLFEVLLYIYFLYSFNKNYKYAKYAIILVILLEIILESIVCLTGNGTWYTAIPYIVIPFSIALTYIERVQRGKYSEIE